jgi:hypothetical protein
LDIVMVLPIWLWLVLIVVVMVASGVAWLKKKLVADPASARAAATGEAIPDAKLQNSCQAQIMQHEITAPGQTKFTATLQPLEFSDGSDRARTPISLVLSEHTMGVSYKKGSLGNTVTFLIDRRDIKSGQADHALGYFRYSVATSRPANLMFRLQSSEDQQLLASWVQQDLHQPGGLQS